jgi:hypothetical protein
LGFDEGLRMEWVIVLVAVAALVLWLSRTEGIGGGVARLLLRAIPRPDIDGRMLPLALIGGIVLGLVAGGLQLAGQTQLAYVAGLGVGPFAGGALLRTRWWVAVAAIVAVIIGAGGEIRPLYVALPVAVIAALGVNFDPRWLRPSRSAAARTRKPERPR